MFNAIINPNNLHVAFQKTQRGRAKYKQQAIDYYRHHHPYLRDLHDQLRIGTYEPGDYHAFLVHEPKEREILAPEYKDKIVQHAVNNVVAPYFRKRYISDSFACIVGKGNRKAVQRLQHQLRQAKYQFGEKAYIVKADVLKFFYTIDRERLKVIVRDGIPCYRTVALLTQIINSSPGNRGLPLGNLTSQLLANIYMNVIDQYCKRTKGYPFYLRYADDIFMVFPNKEQANVALGDLKETVKDMLGIALHPKKSMIMPVDNGLDALGYKIYTTHILLKRQTKIKIKRRLKVLHGRLLRGHITKQQVEQRINAWLNFATLANHQTFVMGLLQRHVFLQFDHRRQVFRVDV